MTPDPEVDKAAGGAWKYYEEYHAFTHKIIEETLGHPRRPELAEEINQQLWVKHLPDKLSAYDPTKGKLESWLAKTAKNYTIDDLRKPKPPTPGEEALPGGHRHDYILQQVANVLDEIARSEGDPAENAAEREQVAAIYCALELTAFGKNWEIAKTELDRDRGDLSYVDYLVKVAAKPYLLTLNDHLYSLSNCPPAMLSYNPCLIRGHVIEGLDYRNLSQLMNCPKDTIKDRLESAVQLFTTILRALGVTPEDLREYAGHRDLGFNKIVRLVFKLLGVGDRLEKSLSEIETALSVEIRAYGLKGAALREEVVDNLLRRYWEKCTCDRTNKDWQYCWKYLQNLFEEYYRREVQLCPSFWDRNQGCTILPTEKFDEWFKVENKRFLDILSRLGLSVKGESIFYYRWVLSQGGQS